MEFSFPVSLGSFNVDDTFRLVRQLGEHNSGEQDKSRKTDLVQLLQDVQVSDQQCFGMGTKAVIKSLESAEITEDEFEQHMIVLGNCVHENVATPWGYHFSEERKLIVYDHYSQGSVFDMLHGDGNRPDCESRVRIAVGAARVIAHIHTQCGGKLVHGNIKSSNIFLNSKHYGCVSTEHKWKNPASASQKGDVYNFGLLLLELVTGKSLVGKSYNITSRLLFSEQAYSFDFLGFKSSMYVDELDIEEKELYDFLADSDLRSWWSKKQHELQRMLQVAERCLAELPRDRPTMSQLVLQLHNIIMEDFTHQNHQHPISYHKNRVWNRFLRFRRRS